MLELARSLARELVQGVWWRATLEYGTDGAERIAIEAAVGSRADGDEGYEERACGFGKSEETVRGRDHGPEEPGVVGDHETNDIYDEAEDRATPGEDQACSVNGRAEPAFGEWNYERRDGGTTNSVMRINEQRGADNLEQKNGGSQNQGHVAVGPLEAVA